MPATYEPIQSYTLGSAAASITFNSIGSSYTDLRLVWVTKNSTTISNPWMRFNSDTGSNYSKTQMFGNGSTTYSSNSVNATKILVGDAAFTDVDRWSFMTVDIFSYAGSTNKTCLITGSADKNGSGHVERQVALWRNTSAITSITLTIEGGAINMDAGTTATLFGIKAA